MIISCPSCNTRYDVPDAAIGPHGRTVQCASCGQCWRAGNGSGTVGGPGASDERGAGAAAGAGIDETVSYDEYDDINAIDVESVYGAAGALEAPLGTPRIVVKRAPGRRGLPAHFGLVIGALAMCGLGIWLREPVVGMVPQTAALFELVGLPVNLVGLDFADVTYERAVEDGAGVLIVKGRIVNTGDAGAYVPAVRLSLLNDADQELFSWTAETEARTLEPGAQIPFQARLASPPEDANNLVVRFATRSG